jgi:hypothetical protein
MYIDQTHKRCTRCRQVREFDYFPKINSRYGGQYEAVCIVCKELNYKSYFQKEKKEEGRRSCSQCNENKPMEDFFDASLSSNYGRICTTCKGPNYKSHKARKDKSKKQCLTCHRSRPIEEFYDPSLKSGYSAACGSCKQSKKTSPIKRDGPRPRINSTRKCSKCRKTQPISAFYDSGLKTQYGVMCKTCKGPGYSEKRERMRAYWAKRSNR